MFSSRWQKWSLPLLLFPFSSGMSDSEIWNSLILLYARACALECWQQQEWHDFIRSLSFSSWTGFSFKRDEKRRISNQSMCVKEEGAEAVCSWSFSSLCFFLWQEILLALIVFWMCENVPGKVALLSAGLFSIKKHDSRSARLDPLPSFASQASHHFWARGTRKPSLSLHHYWLHVHCLSLTSIQGTQSCRQAQYNDKITSHTHTHTHIHLEMHSFQRQKTFFFALCSCAHREESGAYRNADVYPLPGQVNVKVTRMLEGISSLSE